MRVCVLDGGGPKDSENTLNSFLTNAGKRCFDKLVLICSVFRFYYVKVQQHSPKLPLKLCFIQLEEEVHMFSFFIHSLPFEKKSQ